MTSTQRLRAWSAALAAIVGVFLLSVPGSTLAAWYHEEDLAIPQIQTGHLNVRPVSATYTVHSKIPDSHRAFGGGTACAVPAGYQACRTVPAAEAEKILLVPGDRILLTSEFQAEAVGDNLVAAFTISGQPNIQGIPVANTETSFERDGVPVVGDPEVRGDDPESVKKAIWKQITTVTTPDQWAEDYGGKNFTLRNISVTLDQKS